ncbi:helix-turn-helix domain-containing protein [Paenibacillus chungangensis]|uniref:Helix-turn-helix domain-containing protein n=1 Tax=Paenibacillus chungangensis TaxID=696535 RepID=A0ABW3HUH5_9BACL
MTVGVSTLFNRLEHIHTAYKEACDILDMRSVGERGMLFHAASALPGNANVLFASNKKETARKYLENGHVEGAAQLLVQLFTEAREQNMRFAAFRQTASDLLYYAVEAVYARRIDEDKVFGMPAGEMITYVNSLHNPGSIEAACLSVYNNVTSHIQALQQSNQAIAGMLEYIAEHLAEANLTAIAERFNMNSNYVSQYFKKHQGVTYTDYINRLRIEKAKELLLNSNDKAADIGRSVGFNNANAFIRMFKKLEGVTPSEYRKDTRRMVGGYSTMEG